MRKLPHAAVALLIFVVVFPVLQLARATQQSATWDEPMHLTAGYVALMEGDFRVDPSHPPLGRMWAAIPLGVSRPPLDTAVIDRTPAHGWLPTGYRFAREFVSNAGLQEMLGPARAMVVVWGLVLGVLIFAWTFEWLGMRAAVLALVLYTLEPNLAAHTTLVTTDAPLTLLVFAAVYFVWRFSVGSSAWSLWAIAACIGLALVTKFSALLLLPIVCVLITLAAAWGFIRWRHAVLIGGVTAAVSILTIWAAYGFRYAPSKNPNWLLTREMSAETADMPWLTAMLVWADAHHLLPNAFAQGLVFSLSSARELPAFLSGEVRSDGWWYYFPIALALKTPLAILVLGLAGGVVVLRRRRQSAMTAACVIVPIAIWLLGAAASGVNIGVRHVLPVYPFILLLAAAAGAELLSRRTAVAPSALHHASRPARIVLAAALVTVVVEVGRSEPYPLSFFNTLAGGPANGYRYLADSNLGWGGSLTALKRWMDERRVVTINLVYFGSIDPSTYGIRATYLPSSATFLADRYARPQLPGYVAISGTALDGVYLPPWWRHFYAGFRDREPVAVVANTMRIYWVDRWPEAADQPLDPASTRTLAEGLLFGLRWPEHAVHYYDEYLRWHAADPAAWNGRSLALAETGRPSEALAGFRRVLALSPSDPDVRRNIALLEQQVGSSRMARE